MGALSICLSFYAQRKEVSQGHISSCLVGCLEPALWSTCASIPKGEAWEPSFTKLVLYVWSRRTCLAGDLSARSHSGMVALSAQTAPAGFISKGQVAKVGCCFIFVHNYSFVPFCWFHILQAPSFFGNSLILKVHLLSPVLSLSEGPDSLFQVHSPKLHGGSKVHRGSSFSVLVS